MGMWTECGGTFDRLQLQNLYNTHRLYFDLSRSYLLIKIASSNSPLNLSLRSGDWDFLLKYMCARCHEEYHPLACSDDGCNNRLLQVVYRKVQ